MLNVDDLKQAIAGSNVEKIVSLIKKYNLTIDGDKITATTETIDNFEGFWDKRQLIKKINLNSLDTGRVC
jgi:uncharacterized protein YajQ (UPF0234 family)